MSFRMAGDSCMYVYTYVHVCLAGKRDAGGDSISISLVIIFKFYAELIRIFALKLACQTE